MRHAPFGTCRLRCHAWAIPSAARSILSRRKALAFLRSCFHCSFPVSEAGGLTRARTIASIADACGKWCAMGTWAETGVATTAGMHVIASSANFTFCNDSHYMLQSDDILTQPLQIVNGQVALSDKPGLGIELNREKLDAFKRCDVRESVFFDNIEDEQMPLIGQVL